MRTLGIAAVIVFMVLPAYYDRLYHSGGLFV